MALLKGRNAHGGEDDSAGRATAVTDLSTRRIIESADSLTPDVWKQLAELNMKNVEIAEAFNLTKSAVSHMVARYGLETPQTKGQRLWPWKIEGSGLLHAAACEHLRRHVAWMTDGRTGMSLVRKIRLRNFYQKVTEDNFVVEFNPAFPPVKGVSSAGGWKYQKRTKDDGDLIIRVNHLCTAKVDDEFREFWSIPDDGEWPNWSGRYD